MQPAQRRCGMHRRLPLGTRSIGSGRIDRSEPPIGRGRIDRIGRGRIDYRHRQNRPVGTFYRQRQNRPYRQRQNRPYRHKQNRPVGTFSLAACLRPARPSCIGWRPRRRPWDRAAGPHPRHIRFAHPRPDPPALLPRYAAPVEREGSPRVGDGETASPPLQRGASPLPPRLIRPALKPTWRARRAGRGYIDSGVCVIWAGRSDYDHKASFPPAQEFLMQPHTRYSEGHVQAVGG